MVVSPVGEGYILSIQGKVLKEPRLTGWGHIMFSDNETEAGKYIFEETSVAGKYKIRSTSEGINYVNIYKEHGVAGNDKATKPGLATYTIEEVEAIPVSLSAGAAATICFPFNVVIPEGVCAYDVVPSNIKYDEAIHAYTCSMSLMANSGEILKKGTPAIINGSEGVVDFPITMDDNDARNSLPQSLLKGCYVAHTLEQGSGAKRYTLVQQNDDVAFEAFEGSTAVHANGCWLECDVAGADRVLLRFDEATGIHDTPSAENDADKEVYNIAGQCLDSQQEGLNIVGNKKVLVY